MTHSKHHWRKYLATALLLATSSSLLAQEADVLTIVKTNFEAADADGNGSLDSIEFPSLINANAENQIGRAAMVKRFGAYDRAFSTADRNGDGEVAWTEILAARE